MRGMKDLRVVVMAGATPNRSAVLAAVEGLGADVRVVAGDRTALEVAALAPSVLVLDAQEGVPLLPAIDALLAEPALRSVPLLVAVDAARLHVIERAPRLADFIVKPFAGHELRVRFGRLLQGPRAEAEPSVLTHGALSVDGVAREARVAGAAVGLTFQEFELLAFLMANPGRAFSRTQLVDRLWDPDYDGGARTVDIHVRRLRQKLGAAAAPLLTVRGVGYKFGGASGAPPAKAS